jgi:hypothetical protein
MGSDDGDMDADRQSRRGAVHSYGDAAEHRRGISGRRVQYRGILPEQRGAICPGAYAYTDSNPVRAEPNTYSDTDSDLYPHSQSDGYVYSNSNSYSHSYSNGYSYSYGYGYGYTHLYAHSHTYSNSSTSESNNSDWDDL